MEYQASNPSQPNQAYSNHEEATPQEMQTLESQLKGKYHIIKPIGKGAQGHVFLAENTQTNQKVAIKQLLIQSVKDWKLYDLFHREAQTLQRLDIQGVAKLHETMEILDTEMPMALIIQDYIPGDPMQAFIAKGHRFRIEQIGEILLQLTEILEKLHKSDPPVIHRDLKPSNIILSYENDSSTPSVHIIDFGAVANPQVKGGGSTVVGTYGYMAPEQLMGHATPQSDIYSLAIIAVYLMSGVAPENLEIEDFHVLIDPHLEHLPHEITSFLRAMLAPKIEDRMSDYTVIRAFFDDIRNQNFEDIAELTGKSGIQSKQEYSLSDVTSYHQAGNIEIWQALPEQTPRKLPKQLKNRILVETKRNSKYLYLTLGVSVLLCFYVFFLLYIMLGGYDILPNSIVDIFLFFNGYLIFFFIISFFVTIILVAKRLSSNEQLLFEEKSCLCFIQNARKSMATVIRVEYIPASQSENTPQDKYQTDSLAEWMITYSFNPPDDSSPDPLIHKFKTHAVPDNLQEGSLIPILYRIDHSNDTEQVISTPYPIANCDHFNFEYNS